MGGDVLGNLKAQPFRVSFRGERWEGMCEGFTPPQLALRSTLKRVLLGICQHTSRCVSERKWGKVGSELAVWLRNAMALTADTDHG